MTAKSEVSDSLDTLSPFELYPFASYVEHRSYGNPFKRHKTLAHARAAISAAKYAARTLNAVKLYRWEGVVGEDGRWVEIND